MTDLEKIELAIRRAASQMPNYQSRAFRLVADEIAVVNMSKPNLDAYRLAQSKLD